MTESQDRPAKGAEATTPPARKTAAKKAPAKKAPAVKAPAVKAAAKKAPAKKAPAKKAPAKKAPVKKAPPAPPQPALAAGVKAPALNPAPTPRLPQESFGRGHTIPLSLGLAAAGLVALAISRFRRD